MHQREELRARAERARDKPPAVGADVSLEGYDPSPVPHEEGMGDLAVDERRRLEMAGMDLGERERGGTYIQRDTSVVRCGASQPGLEVMSIRQALERADWARELYWTLVPVDQDRYTAAAELELHNGYVIRALAGTRSIYPVQACLYMGKEGLQQNVHNIIVAEEDSELHIITGCATGPRLRRGIHVGVSEFFVRKNARVTFTMIHNWAEEVVVRPRSAAVVEEGGLFINNYICLKPVRSLQMYPTTVLQGEGAVGRFYSIIVGSEGSEVDVGGRMRLEAPGARAEVVARAITRGGRIVARGHLIGDAPEIKAHLECRGLIIGGGSMVAIPELEGHVDGVEMSHEAAVGKIAQEEIFYLMSRGLSEDEATSTIVRGFLNVDIPGLPGPLRVEIDRAIEESQRSFM